MTETYANLTDAQILQQAPCFGASFSKVDAECTQCEVRARCVNRTVKHSIPEMLEQRGTKDLTAEMFIEHFESEHPDTAQHLVQIALGQRTMASILAPSEADAPTEIEVESVPETESDEAPPEQPTVTEEKAKELAPEPPKAKKKAKGKTAPAEEAGFTAEVAVAAPQKKVAPKKAAKKVAPKKAAKKGKPSGAPKNATKVWASSAEVQKRVEKAKPPKPGDGQSWTALWQIERERTPAVKALKPGTKIVRNYRGVSIEVTYHDGYVTFRGEKWPTLASVKNAIVERKDYPTPNGEGRRQMTNWSVPRFFHLGAAKVFVAKGKKKAKKGKKAA